jgi:hypothetical protein
MGAACAISMYQLWNATHSWHTRRAGTVDRMNTWGVRKTAGAIAVAAAVAGVGGAAIAAATDGGFHAMSGGFAGSDGFGGPPPSAHHTNVEPGSLHGEYVVADGHGGFSTLISQTGRITAISATTITARSDDGFVQSYAIHDIGAVALPPFAVNDEVTINAKREGPTVTVTTMRPPLASGH